MQSWNQILHTALLGTDKETLDSAALDPELAAAGALTVAAGQDKEDRFLRMASLVLNYRQAGADTPVRENAVLPVCPPEEAAYCSKKANQVLADLFSESNISLIHLWLQLCANKGRLVSPEWLPKLLQLAVTEKGIIEYVARCGGQRGVWLARLNPVWELKGQTTPEEQWQTGSPDQRRQVLTQLRHTDPAQARDWLQQTWATEDANTKADLIRQLVINISESDLSFLESLQTEKSKKVKDEILVLQKKIPASAQVRLATELTLKSLVPPSKGSFISRLLPSAKGSLKAEALPAQDQALLKPLGVDLLSNRKELSDDEFILYQLLKFVPLERLESAWQMDTKQLMGLFYEEGPGQKLLPALVLSIVHYGDKERALIMAQHGKSFYLDLLPLLPADLQDAYSTKYFSSDAASIIQYATRREQPWGSSLALAILKHAAANPYQYNKAFFMKHIRLVPVSVLSEAGKIQGEGPYAYLWEPVRDAVIQQLEMKQRTLNAFNE